MIFETRHEIFTNMCGLKQFKYRVPEIHDPIYAPPETSPYRDVYFKCCVGFMNDTPVLIKEQGFYKDGKFIDYEQYNRDKKA